MQFHQAAEVISMDHRVVAEVKIISHDTKTNTLYTLIPRSLSGSPVPFSKTETYNIIYTSYESIFFFEAQFEELTTKNNKPSYKFRVNNYNSIENIRKEERKSVEYQAVVSDFNKIGLVTILDLSYSGLKIESDIEITSEFVEIFFDEENVPRRALGKVRWEKRDEERNKNFYGISLRYR